MPPESGAAGAGPSLTTPPNRDRAPRSYLGGREGGGGRRPAGPRLLLLGRVVQQNFAALVELPHGGRGAAPLRAGSERAEAGAGAAPQPRPGRLRSAGLSPRRGLPAGSEGRREELPGGAGIPPPAAASPTGLRMEPGCGRAARGGGGAGRAGQGREPPPPPPPLLTCRPSPPEPPPPAAVAPPPLPCLRGGSTGRGGGPASPGQQHRARRQHPRLAPQPPAGTGRGLGVKKPPSAGRCSGGRGWRCPAGGWMAVRVTRDTRS